MTMTTSPAQVTATFTSTSKCRGKTIFHITGAQAVTWEYCGFYDNSLTSDGICHAWMEITGGVTFKECRFGGDFTWAGGPSNTDPTWVGCYGNCGSCAGEALSVSLTAFVTTYCALPPDPRNDTFVDASATFSKSNGLSVSRAMTDSFKMAPTGPVNPSSDIAPSYSHPNSNACPPTAQIVVSSDLPPSVNVTASAPHEVTTALEISADLPPSAVIGSSVELNDSAAIRPSGVLPATVPLRISSFLPPSLPIAPSVLPNVSAAFPRTNAFPATGLIANSNQHPPTKPLVVSDVFLSQPIADSLNFRETNDHNETAEFSPSKTFSGSQPLVSQKIDFSAKFASTASLLPATSPSPSASASPLDPTAEFSLSEDLKGIDGSGSGGGGLAIGAILGIVFAILFLLALAAAGGLYYQKVILPRNQKKESSEVHDYTAEFFHGQQKEQEHEMSVDFNNPMFDDAVGADEDDTFEQNLKSDPDEML
jgi:hypothetical protein